MLTLTITVTSFNFMISTTVYNVMCVTLDLLIFDKIRA